jgi:gliding motility-associated-like protein
MKKIYLLTLMLLLSFTKVNAQVITVSTTEYTHEELVTDVLINSPCAIVDNITTVTGINFGGAFANGIGYFENTNPNFPMANGVILATGNVTGAPGPNNTATWGGGGWPGDAQLFNYIQSLGIDPGLTSYNDATIMEFDFIPLTDSISFNFVFGSNEYGTFQCTFSDAFAFFLENQDTGEIVNMALVPNTTTETPISVTTIRDNLYNGSCSSENPEYFDLYYGTPNGLPDATAPVNLNGHTVLMQAWQYVTPNTEYRMKLVIADRNDSSWDSAVFIEGGSFFIGNADLGDDITIANGNALCDNEELILTVSAPEGSEITWFFNGEEIPGENGDSLPVLEPGIYGVEIINPFAPDCVISDEITIEFITSPIVDLGGDVLVCGEIFATLDGTPENIDDLGDVTYEWFYNGVSIPDETEATIDVTEIGDYMVEVTSELGCVGTDEIAVVIADFMVDLGPDATPCDETEFELFAEVIGIDPADVSFLWSTGATTQSIFVTVSDNYSVEVSYLDCTETDTINVTFTELPAVDLGGDIVKCAQDQVIVDATPSNVSSGVVSYTWYQDGGQINDATSSTLTITQEGLYRVEVEVEGCITIQEITVSFYDNENCIITQGISPNGDGLNDCFDLEFLNDDPGIVNLSIFNRYGRLVYERNNYVNEWCGQAQNGEKLPVGTYFYLINLQNEPAKSGYIYINY